MPRAVASVDTSTKRDATLLVAEGRAALAAWDLNTPALADVKDTDLALHKELVFGIGQATYSSDSARPLPCQGRAAPSSGSKILDKLVLVHR